MKGAVVGLDNDLARVCFVSHCYSPDFKAALGNLCRLVLKVFRGGATMKTQAYKFGKVVSD
jgi:hypothetical protein